MMDWTLILALLLVAVEVSEEMFVEDWLPQAAINRHINKYKYFLMVSPLY